MSIPRPNDKNQPQPVRLPWEGLPPHIHDVVAERLGSPVVKAVSERSGFSPGAAVRLLTADGRRIFIKAISTDQNPHSPGIYRRDAYVNSLLPPSARESCRHRR